MRRIKSSTCRVHTARGHLLFTYLRTIFIIINWNFNGTQLPLSSVYVLPKPCAFIQPLPTCLLQILSLRPMSQTDKREMLLHLLPISRIKDNNNINSNSYIYTIHTRTHMNIDSITILIGFAISIHWIVK